MDTQHRPRLLLEPGDEAKQYTEKYNIKSENWSRILRPPETTPNNNSAHSYKITLLLFLLVYVCESTLATILPVKVSCHEYAGTTLWPRALPPQTLDLAGVVDLVVFEDGQLHLLLFMLDLLGCGVVLLLPLLPPSPETQHQVEGGLLLDVVVREGSAIFQLFPGKDESLLVRWDACTNTQERIEMTTKKAEGKYTPSLSWIFVFTFSMVSLASTY